MSAQPEFKKYPLWMRHPHEKPAVISDDWCNGPPSLSFGAQAGKSLRFAPVMVVDQDAEDYHRAQGYEPVNGNPTAYLKAVIAPEPAGHVHHEYPKMVDGQIDLGPDAPPPPDNFYPYYVRMEGYEPTLVQDKDEHQALLEERGTGLPPASDVADQEIAELERRLAELRARKTEQPLGGETGPVASLTGPSRADLLSRALELGIKADRRWGETRLREAIAEAQKTE